MKRLISLAFAATILLAACGGGDSPAMGGMDHGGGSDDAGAHSDPKAKETAAPAGCLPSGAALSIVAKDTAFDKACLAAPAGQSFTIAFKSDDALPHNIAVLEGHSSTKVLFRGEIFPGPKTTTYDVPALKAGTYAFHCEVHPDQMKGTFVVS